MEMPLDGMRIVDWTIFQQGTVASTMLADLGAEVIKIEERVRGDPGRGVMTLGGLDLGDLPNAYFEANNRNKKSLALDLKQPEGLEIVHRLVVRSDVFVQNFRKGVAERLGLDYETLRNHNPRIVYATASGYGPNGADSSAPAFDLMGQARSGAMLAAGEPGMPPLTIGAGPADQAGGMMLAYGVLAALLARQRHGVGQRVDASLLGAMTFLQGLSVSMQLMTGRAMPRWRRAAPSNPLFNYYRCADGQWIALGMLQGDRYWADFCGVVGRPELVADERFENLTARARNSRACVEILDAVFGSRPRAEWLEVLRSGGDFIFTQVNDLEDLQHDPQVLANDYVVDFAHPAHGTIQVLGIPVSLSETPGRVRAPAPELGQHTEEVLTELLGYSWDDIAALRSRGVI